MEQLITLLQQTADADEKYYGSIIIKYNKKVDDDKFWEFGDIEDWEDDGIFEDDMYELNFPDECTFTGSLKYFKKVIDIFTEHFTKLNNEGVDKYLMICNICTTYNDKEQLVFNRNILIDNNRKMDFILLNK